MDWTKRTNNAQFMDKETAGCNNSHQTDPEIADAPMGRRTLGHGELKSPEPECDYGGNRMPCDNPSLLPKRINIHVARFLRPGKKVGRLSMQDQKSLLSATASLEPSMGVITLGSGREERPVSKEFGKKR